MKCQILFSGKNKKNNIILSSAENAQRVVKVKVLYNPNCVCKYKRMSSMNIKALFPDTNKIVIIIILSSAIVTISAGYGINSP